MKILTKLRFGSTVFLLSFLILMVAGCSIDGENTSLQIDDQQLIDLKNSNISRLSENPELMNALIRQAEKGLSENTVSPEMDFSARADKKWVATATGGGMNLYDGSEEPNFKFTFQAKEDNQGNDVGSILYMDTKGGKYPVPVGEVDCLFVEENRAWIRFIVDLKESGLFHIWVGFEDNGEGVNADPDRQTYVYGAPYNERNGSCEYFAATNGFGYGFPVEFVRGNIQVKGASLNIPG